MAVPSQDVVNAIESGITHVTRRVEIFESDGVTPFYPNGSEEDVKRLIDGSVTIDSGRSERRGLDITFDNIDNMMRPNSEGGFWYDKVIRPYRGVRYASRDFTPRILIVESTNKTTANELKAVFTQLGFNRVDINLSATTLSELSGYRVIVADGGSGAITKSPLLQAAFRAGFGIFTKGLGNGVGELPWVTGEFAFTSASPLSVTPRTFDTPIAGGWSAETEGSAAGTGITAIDATALGMATSLNNSTTHFTVTGKATDAARWVDYKPALIGVQARTLVKNAINWVWNYQPYMEWETSLGMFLIDTMKTQNFPNQVSVSARDFTKKCLKSKITKNMSFDSSTLVSEFITALAANAGIKNISIPPSAETIGVKIDATRGTERWALMNQAAQLAKTDISFDLDGFLVMTPWADPTLGSPLASFKTGPQGNLASYDRSSSDERIFNRIVVTGTADGADAEALGYYGEASNTNPNSPTNIDALGDRTYFYNSPFFTSNGQCADYAQALLAQTAFEQYELNLSSFVYPWLDANMVIDFQEPDALELDPTRFVANSLTIPLDLSPMPCGAKRVVFIEGEDQEAA